MIIDNFDPLNESNIVFELSDLFDKKDQKQNMSLEGFSTTKDLDLELETILKSIEPEVISAIEKVLPKK